MYVYIRTYIFKFTITYKKHHLLVLNVFQSNLYFGIYILNLFANRKSGCPVVHWVKGVNV